jgi:DNA-directed RNA polymerase subunit omega
MARITVEDCLKKVNNRFILIQMADKRCRHLLKGTPPLVHAPDNREVVQSLREIAAGKVYLESETVQRLQSGGYLDKTEK